MIKALVDSDVALDLLAARAEHFEPAKLLFTLIDQGKVKGFISAISFTNLHYVIRSSKTNAEAVRGLERLKSLVAVAPVDDKVISLALASSFSDFEDAVQYYSAVGIGATHLITRNVRDYKHAAIPVMNPQEFARSLT